MTINWKLTILAGVLGTLALDLTGLLLTGEWWDIPQLLGSKLGAGLASGVVAHYGIGSVLAVIYAAIAPSLWGPKIARALTYITIQTVLGVFLFMFPLLDMGIAGLGAGIVVPFIALIRHWVFGLVLAALVPIDEQGSASSTTRRVSVSSATLAVIASALISQGAAAQLPDPGMTVDLENTALVITDPQNDFLSPEGVAWGVVGKSVTENKTVEHIDTLLKAAKESGMPVFISPHYYFPTDHGWKFEGALERLMHNIGMFDRKGPLSLEDFEGSGPDWLSQYKKYIEDGKTVVTSPHKVYGPETNDLVLQLRKRGIDKVILGGMSANLCVESHMRELLEQGFEVAVVKDATAAAVVPDGDGYKAALINFRFIANTVWTTDEATERIRGAAQSN
jgi:nicotinamidase-related amidase